MQQTDDWQQFVLYRMADETGKVRVIFSLSGLGEAFVDAVSVHPIPYSPSTNPLNQQANRLQQMVPLSR